MSPTAPTAGLVQPTCMVGTGTIRVSSATAGLYFSIDGLVYTNTTGIFALVPAGDYYVTARNEAGCISSPSLKLTIVAQQLAPTVVSASVNPGSVVSSGQVVFSAMASSGAIKWFDAATGGTEVTVLNPIIYATTTYYAEAISPEGCISVSRTVVTAMVIPQGAAKELSYRFANPKIINGSGFDSFEFDVQVKANEAGTYFWEGDINLNFNSATLSSDAANWIATLSNSWGNSKYGTAISINGSTVNINVTAINKSASATDFVEVTTNFQTMVRVSGRIINNTGTAGIDFNEGSMNGQQFYMLPASPWYTGYTNPNRYDGSDFMDTYVERVFCAEHLWTQVGGLNWANAANTSVWNGNATIPGSSLSNASALRIHDPATLMIPVNASLTITGNTEIKTTVGLTIQSDASGTGSLITETASGVGLAIAERYMTTDAWHLVASPLSGQIISTFLATNANIATSDNGVRGMMDYNPTLNEWNDYFTNATGGNIETGKGFCMRTNATSAVDFEGKLQAGFLTANGISEKWNCIGNPYTSAIGINKGSSSSINFLDENIDNLDPFHGAIYVWDELDASNGLWGMYTTISNVPDPFDVQQGQAFMVKVNAGASSVNFNSGMQIHESALALKSTKGLWPTIKLKASVNSQQASTIIAFNNGMTKGLDRTYDAGLLKGSSDLLVYSRLVEDNGIPFAIQALPTDDYKGMIIPVGLDFKTGGQVVFSSELANLSSDCQVILEDKKSKTFTDLSKKVYTTTIAANSSVSDRFYLHTSYQTTGIDVDPLVGKMSAYAISNVEMVVKGNVSNQAVATLYDVLGRLVLTTKLEAYSQNTIRLPNIKTGIYMLYVRDNGMVQGFKVPVKE